MNIKSIFQEYSMNYDVYQFTYNYLYRNSNYLHDEFSYDEIY